MFKVRISQVQRHLQRMLINFDIVQSCRPAQKYLKGRSVGILVDNSIFGQASTTHQTYSYKKTVEWPSGTKNERHVVSVEPIYVEHENKETADNIRFLPGLIYLFSQGNLGLFTSDVLRCEQSSQPIGRYNDGISIFDYDLFENVQFGQIDGYEALCNISDALEWINGKIHFKKDFFEKAPTFNGMIFSTDIDPFGDCPDAKNRLQQYLMKKRTRDSQFDSIVNCLGEKNMQDAWHIYTAEIHKLDYYLTLDFKLLRTLSARRGHKVIQELNVQSVTPKQLA